MTDILDLADAASGAMSQPLEPVRLSENAALLLLFTRDAERVKLHFVSDPAVNSYVACHGPGRCPMCHCAQVPSDLALLPVVNVAVRAVQVLRISMRKGPGALMTLLTPHLRGEDLVNKLFRIQRLGAKYVVDVQALAPDADRCVVVVKDFDAAHKSGLKLSSAFPDFTPAELAEVPQVRQMLDSVGGWKAPEAD